MIRLCECGNEINGNKSKMLCNRCQMAKLRGLAEDPKRKYVRTHQNDYKDILEKFRRHWLEMFGEAPDVHYYRPWHPHGIIYRAGLEYERTH